MDNQEQDPLFEMAIDFLENGGKLPGKLTAGQRFHVLAAMQRHMSGKLTDTRDYVKETRDKLDVHLAAHDRGMWMRKRMLKWVGGVVGAAATISGILRAIGVI